MEGSSSSDGGGGLVGGRRGGRGGHCPKNVALLLLLLHLATPSSEAASPHHQPLPDEPRIAQDIDYLYTDDLLTEDDGDPRILFTSTTTVTTNSTLLRAIGALIGALLLALPLYLAYATSFDNSQGYGHRYKREQKDDFDTLLLLLSETFRKYNVNDLGCQILMACEAGGKDAKSKKKKKKKRDKYGWALDHVGLIIRLAKRASSTQSEFEQADEGTRRILVAHSMGEDGAHCANEFGSSCKKET